MVVIKIPGYVLSAHVSGPDKNFFGAGDGIRTHDPNLGKVVLYP